VGDCLVIERVPKDVGPQGGERALPTPIKYVMPGEKVVDKVKVIEDHEKDNTSHLLLLYS